MSLMTQFRKEMKLCLQKAVKTGPEAPVVVHVPIALTALATNTAMFIAFVLCLWNFLQPLPEEVERLTPFLTPAETWQQPSACRDATNYGDSGIYLTTLPSLGRLFVKGVVHPDLMLDQILSMSCAVPSDGGMLYKETFGFIETQRSTAGSCFAPGESAENFTLASFGSVVDLKSGFIAMKGIVDVAYAAFRRSDPAGDHPDFIGGSVYTQHTSSAMHVHYNFFFAWALNTSRPVLLIEWVHHCDTLAWTSSYEITVDCKTGSGFGYRDVVAECANRDRVPPSRLTDLAWGTGNVTFIRRTMELIDKTYDLLQAQFASNCQPFAVKPLYDVYFDSAAKQLFVSAVENYRKEKRFRFSCTSFRPPDFLQRIAHIYPWVSIAATILTAYFTNFTYKTYLKFIRCSSHLDGTNNQRLQVTDDYENLVSQIKTLTVQLERLEKQTLQESSTSALALGALKDDSDVFAISI